MSAAAEWWAWRQKCPSPATKLVLLAYASLVKEGGPFESYATTATLMERTNIGSEATVLSARKLLAKAGLLHKTGGKVGGQKRIDVYALLTPAGAGVVLNVDGSIARRAPTLEEYLAGNHPPQNCGSNTPKSEGTDTPRSEGINTPKSGGQERFKKDSKRDLDSFGEASAQGKQKAQGPTAKKELASNEGVSKAKRGLAELIAEGMDGQHAADLMALRNGKAFTETEWQGQREEASKSGLSVVEALTLAAKGGYKAFRHIPGSQRATTKQEALAAQYNALFPMSARAARVPVQPDTVAIVDGVEVVKALAADQAPTAATMRAFEEARRALNAKANTGYASVGARGRGTVVGHQWAGKGGLQEGGDSTPAAQNAAAWSIVSDDEPF